MANTPTDSRWREAPPTLPSIEVRVALRGEPQPPDKLSPDQWWTRIFKATPELPSGVSLQSHCEWVLQNRFPKILREKWAEHFGPRRESRAADILAAQFAFRVTRIEYGSPLEFLLEIAGLESLAGLLGSDLDLFQMLTEIYVPAAFVEAFDLLNENTEHIEFSYIPSGEVIHAFSALPTASAPTQLQPAANVSPTYLFAPSTGTLPATSQGRDRSRGLDEGWWRRFMMLNNFSLVIPLILLIVVGWIFVNVSERLASQQLELTKTMLDQQKAVVEAQTRRNTEMERLTLDVLRQALPSTATAAPRRRR